MARQIRHNVEGGWYHITTRGMGRREIFSSDRDREHFIGLLKGLVGRYGIVLHAYVLMDNHYLVKAVEAVKGEEWGSFADRKGDCGRDLALYVARMNCWLSVPEPAALAGAEPAAASKAIQRMRKRLAVDRKLKSMFRKVSAEIGVREK